MASKKCGELRPTKIDRELTNGPSKLCLALGISSADNGVDLTSPDSDLILADNPERDVFLQTRAPEIQTTRIGLSKGRRLAVALDA